MSQTSIMANILIVEDDPELAESIKGAVLSGGYSVKGARSGLEAINLLGLEEFSLVLSDIRMPEMNGIELLHQIKRTHNIPVILMTGFSELSETKEASEIGAAGFLAKPFRRNELLELIEKILPRAEQVLAPPIHVNVDDLYCAIPIDDFVSGSEIQYEIFIRLSAEKYIKVANRGEKLDLNRIQIYKSKGIHNLFLLKQDFLKYIGFNLTLAEAVIKSDKVDEDKKNRYLMHTVTNIVQSFYTHELSKESFEIGQMVVQTAVTALSSSPSLLSIFEDMEKHSDYLYTHSLGVSLFSAMIAKELGWTSQKTLVTASMCGLMHDIGKKELDRKLLEKPRVKCTSEEIALIETHTTRGMKMLHLVPGVTEELIQVITQHHEDCAGSGYPFHLPKARTAPLARLVALANAYCDIALKGPDSPGYPFLEAFSRLKQNASNRFDSEYVEALSRVMQKQVC